MKPFKPLEANLNGMAVWAGMAPWRIGLRMDHYLPEVKQIVGLNDELDQQGFGIGLFR